MGNTKELSEKKQCDIHSVVRSYLKKLSIDVIVSKEYDYHDDSTTITTEVKISLDGEVIAECSDYS